MPGSVAGSLPGSLDSAIGLARDNSPRVKAARADIDTAAADVQRGQVEILSRAVRRGQRACRHGRRRRRGQHERSAGPPGAQMESLSRRHRQGQRAGEDPPRERAAAGPSPGAPRDRGSRAHLLGAPLPAGRACQAAEGAVGSERHAGEFLSRAVQGRTALAARRARRAEHALQHQDFGRHRQRSRRCLPSTAFWPRPASWWA